MVEPKAGSRKAQVYAVYHAKGAEAAYALGAKLELSTGTVRSWVTLWSRERPPTKSGAIKAAAKQAGMRVVDIPLKNADMRGLPTPEKESNDNPLPAGTKRVCWHTDRSLRATVKEAGPQQSTIKWDNGNIRHEPNRLLSPLTEKELEQERQHGKIK